MENAFCHPKGIPEYIGGWLLSLDRDVHSWVVDLLQIGSFDHVLDVGSGPGLTLALAAGRASRGKVVGVDPSKTMTEIASRRNRGQIEAGRVEVILASVDDLPFDQGTFDAAIAINSLHLWPDAARGLREVRRTLRPGGRIAVAITRFSSSSPDKFEDQLTAGGFSLVALTKGESGICALGRA